jgi:hypothetical protein
MSSVQLSQILLGRLAAHARARGAAPALAHKRRGRWRALDWRAVADEVTALAHGLAELGVRDGDTLSLTAAAPGPRAVLVALAAQVLGATALAADADRLGALLAKLPRNPDASPGDRFAFADDESDVARVCAADKGGALVAIVHGETLGGKAGRDPRLRAYDQLRSAGARIAVEGAPLLPAGAPHAETPAGLWAALSEEAPASDDDRAERLLFVEGLAAPSAPALLARWLARGGLLASPERDGDAERDRRELAPTALVASSAWVERLWAETAARLPAPGTWGRRLVDRALAEGARGPLAQRLVLARIARGLGLDRVRAALVIGDAPDAGSARLLAALGVLPGTTAEAASAASPSTVQARTAA